MFAQIKEKLSLWIKTGQNSIAGLTNGTNVTQL
jgi:hypothetical protein